eukprot:s142_g12.t1
MAGEGLRADLRAQEAGCDMTGMLQGEFTAALRGFGAVDRWPEALATLDGWPAEVDACVHWERTTELFVRLRRCEVRPNAFMYSSLITAHEKAAQWAAALDTVRLAPGNVVAVSSALSVLSRIPTSWGQAWFSLKDGSAMSLTNGDVEDPHQQALLVHDVFQTSSLQQGDTWYVLSMRWWDLWKDYTLFEPAPQFQSRSCSGTTKGEKPPNIDNSDLIIRPGCTQLQSDLVENRDFILLNKDVWKLLHTWYPGGPILRRRVIGEGQNMNLGF